LTRVATPRPGVATPVPLQDVERELARRLRAVQGPGESPVVRACMSNLVIFCGGIDWAERAAAEVPAIVAQHPARVLLLVAEPGSQAGELTSAVRVWGHVTESARWLVSEQVTLHAKGQAVARLPFAVRALVVGDLPMNLWWGVPQPPPVAGPLLHDLAEYAQQVIYDSIGWPEPARGVVATATWLAQAECGPGQGPWRLVADLNWRRLKYWRRLLGQALDPATAPGALESVTELTLEHGPHAVIQAWELASWFASCLGWQVQAGRLQPGVEIAWHFRAPSGRPTVRIRRLETGPSAIQRVRVACTLGGRATVVKLTAEGEHRLSAVLEGTDAAPRTIAVPPQTLADLVARQLSDRERDPVFKQSMAVARVLAESVLG
jgi:glucose-6-phosphate dehydrogenase assembly protein OpcA